MRYDTPVYFQHVTPGEYDPNTGNYLPDAVREVMKRASVTSTGVGTLRLLYGELKQGSYVVRLQRAYTEPFDHIRIGTKVYNVDMTRSLRTKMSFVIHEVQGNGDN